MNQFTVTAPVADFSGESAGVVFKDGVGHVSDASKEGRAAIEYFRRRRYALTPVQDEKPEEEGLAEPQKVDDPKTQFDPSERKAEEVIAYLGTLDVEDPDGKAEFDRVMAAERDGKNRTTILALSEQQQGAQQ